MSLIFFIFSVPPLFVIEFLHRVMDTFEDYFNDCNESTIKENYVIVYEVSPFKNEILQIYCQ